MELLAVYYNYEGEFKSEPRELECITDNFEKWFKKLNEGRKAEGEMEYQDYEFDVEPVSPILYNKEVK